MATKDMGLMCEGCAWRPASTEQKVCLAFPEGIPEKYLLQTELHLQVDPDQENDVIYEQDPTRSGSLEAEQLQVHEDPDPESPGSERDLDN